MTRVRRDRWLTTSLRKLCAGLFLVLAAPMFAAAPAVAQLLPADFFESVPSPGSPAQVEANVLSYNAKTDVISARGRVVMRYSGYSLECDTLRYAQGSGALLCDGHARITDPNGTVFNADTLDVTGGMKQAFIQSLTLTTSDGAMITASDVRYDAELKNVLTDATYSPCGLCVDDKGRRIGWKVRAAKLVQDPTTNEITLESPTLEVLGVPIAWLPWLSLPDPSKPRKSGFQLPSVDYDGKLGLIVRTPYYVALGESMDILLSPQFMTRQGFLMAAEWEQRFDYGEMKLSASGLYQLDPGAFAGEVGDRQWRGAIQSSGHFQLAENWTAGWSATAFSDAKYLDDYDIDNADSLINEVYTTYLSDDYYADLRAQQYLVLGDYTVADQKMQALAIPNLHADAYNNSDAYGQIHVSSTVLGVKRDADATDLYGAVPYVFGYEETKLHATLEASWEKQFITPAGLVVTPYLGIRGDAANFSSSDGLPVDASLLTATPIAAMDVRFPLIASNGVDTQLLEPIAQLVYRGTDTTLTGITNDNAHSFVLDDTNMFSYNRFSGSDRQETGLRANVGARYLATLGDGRWLELMAGQSFHLGGVNSLAIGDEVNTGVSTGLGDDASYIVLAARGSPSDGTTIGAKLQLDPAGPRVARADLGGDVDLGGDYSVGGDYIYLPADTATGVLSDQHEVTVRGSAPLPMDYWKASASLSWDLASSQWLETTGEVLYDDGFFLAGAYAKATGATHEDADSFSFGLKLKLKGPAGKDGF